MKIELAEFIRDNASAIFTLVGALCGTLITFLTTYLLKSSDLRLRLWEKILDRRIQSHEQVIQLARTARVVISVGLTDSKGELVRAPIMFRSRNEFDEWFINWSHQYNIASSWLSTDVIHELNLFQDYLVNVYEFSKSLDDSKMINLGVLLRDDFVDFSTRIEQLAFKFFSRDLRKLRLNDLTKWHKYPPAITQKRLGRTAFFLNSDELEKLKNDT